MSGFGRELARFIADHRLPATFADVATEYYLPLGDWLLAKIDNSGGPTFVAGIYGAQGSGKSTLADLLFRYVTSAGKTVVSLSIDDFYLTKAERRKLAAEISPLLATRGPPGTHDVDLALRTMQRAKSLAKGESLRITRFDKAADDRMPESDHERIPGPVDLVILEGWCLGCRPVEPEALVEPLNALERNEDQDGTWRRFVNESIAAYQPLFDLIDAFIMLKTANFDAVLNWRREQEDKLRTSAQSADSEIMTGSEVGRFVQFFERVSRNTEPQVERTADVVLTLDEYRGIRSVHYP